MGVSSLPLTTVWGPGYIGLVIATFLYGVELCQLVFYFRTFQSDRVVMKLQVCVVVILDTVHSFAVVASFYNLLVGCRRDTDPICSYYVPWMMILAILLVYCTTFMVQAFYAHRVWIISGRNAAITSAVVAFTATQLAFGLVVIIELVQTPTFAVLYSSEYPRLSAVASAVCDAAITLSVMYYLRPSEVRREGFIGKLLVIFVGMGLFTFINAVVLAVLCSQRSPRSQFFSTAPGVTLSTSYANSMLAVLNARKVIRDKQQDALVRSIELPTIPTLR